MVKDANAIARAYGIVLAILDGLLVDEGVLRPGELMGHLDITAHLVAGQDPHAADVVQDWADTLAKATARKSQRQ